MKKKFQILLVLIVMICLSVGCTSQTESPTSSGTVIPTTPIRDLHTVIFHLVDQNDTPIYNALITANYNSSEYPNNLNTPNNNRGYTDENGNISFVMRGSIQYGLTTSNLLDKQEIVVSITPIEREYSLRIKPTAPPTSVPTTVNPFENNAGYQISKGICSLIPYINKALDC